MVGEVPGHVPEDKMPDGEKPTESLGAMFRRIIGAPPPQRPSGEAEEKAPEPDPSEGWDALKRALQEGAAAKEAGKLTVDEGRYQERLVERLAVLKAAESGRGFGEVFKEEKARVAEMLGPAPEIPGEPAPEVVTGVSDVVNLEHDLDKEVGKLIRRQAEKRVRESEMGGGLTTDQLEAAIAGEEEKIRAEMNKALGTGETAEAPAEAAPEVVEAPAPPALAPAVEKVRPEPLSQRFDTVKFSEVLMGLSADAEVPADFAANLKVALKVNLTKTLLERVRGGHANFPPKINELPPGEERDKAVLDWAQDTVAEGIANDLTQGGSNPLQNAFRLYTSVGEGLRKGLAQEDRDPETEAMRVTVYALTNVAKITAPDPFASQPTPGGTLGDPLDKIFVNVAEAVLRRDSSHALHASEKLGRLFTQKQPELEAIAVS